MSKKAYKKYNFPQRVHEYIDEPELPEDAKTYYDKFNNENYGNSLSKDNLNSQLHNTPELVKSVYDQSNARSRCLLTKMKITKQLDPSEEQESTHLYQDDKYYRMMKVDGYNLTLKEIFEDFSLLLTETTTPHHTLQHLKSFYVATRKLDREEKKWKKNEKLILKEEINATTT